MNACNPPVLVQEGDVTKCDCVRKGHPDIPLRENSRRKNVLFPNIEKIYFEKPLTASGYPLYMRRIISSLLTS
jgi:hypothetical protein